MARIQGVDLPRNKRIVVGLTYIYGIGRTRSEGILEQTGIDPSIRVRDLTEEQVGLLRNACNEFVLEADLRREVQMNIKRLVEIGSYRGLRHKRNSASPWPAYSYQCTHPPWNPQDCSGSWSSSWCQEEIAS